jgi:hypothetical protein
MREVINLYEFGYLSSEGINVTEKETRWAACKIEFSTSVGAYNVIDYLEGMVLPAVFGYEAGEAALSAAYEKLGLIFDLDQFEESGDAESKLPIYSYMYALFAYARYGLVDRSIIKSALDHFGSYQIFEPGAESDALLIESFVQLSSDFFGPESSVFPKMAGHNMESEVRAAQARLKIDVGSDSDLINPLDLSKLVKIKVKSVQNEMGTGKVLFSDQSGGIPVASAKRWLRARPKYLWSLLDVDENEHPSGVNETSLSGLHEVLFLPVDRNGGYFSPAHRQNGQYIVGERGSEQKFTDYLVALETLQKLESPAWRSPTIKGHWTLAFGVNWDRKTAAQIGLNK